MTSRGRGKQGFGIWGIYLKRASLPGNELDDWLQAEREVDGRAPPLGESTDMEKLKP